MPSYSQPIHSVDVSDIDSGFSGVSRVRALIDRADDALERGDIDTYLRMYQVVGMTPPRNQILEFASRSLSDGRFNDGLFAYTLLGIFPDRDDLEACAEQLATDPFLAARARYLAHAATPRVSSERGVLSRLADIIRR